MFKKNVALLGKNCIPSPKSCNHLFSEYFTPGLSVISAVVSPCMTTPGHSTFIERSEVTLEKEVQPCGHHQLNFVNIPVKLLEATISDFPLAKTPCT